MSHSTASRSGDAAFGARVLECVPKLRPRVAGYLRGFDGVDVDDVVQDTVERAWKHRDGIDPDKLLAWCAVTAKRRVLDLRRQAGGARHVPVADMTTACDGSGATGPDPADLYADLETVRAVRRALGELPDRYRQPLVAATYRGLDQRQIAAELSMTVPQVNMLMHRGRAKLRRSLRALDPSTSRPG